MSLSVSNVDHYVIGRNYLHKSSIRELNTLSYRFYEFNVSDKCILELFCIYKEEAPGHTSNDIIFMDTDRNNFINMLKKIYQYNFATDDEYVYVEGDLKIGDKIIFPGISFKPKYSTFTGLAKLIDSELIDSIENCEYIAGGRYESDKIIYKGKDLSKPKDKYVEERHELLSLIHKEALRRLMNDLD